MATHHHDPDAYDLILSMLKSVDTKMEAHVKKQAEICTSITRIETQLSMMQQPGQAQQCKTNLADLSDLKRWRANMDKRAYIVLGGACVLNMIVGAIGYAIAEKAWPMIQDIFKSL